MENVGRTLAFEVGGHGDFEQSSDMIGHIFNTFTPADVLQIHSLKQEGRLGGFQNHRAGR